MGSLLTAGSLLGRPTFGPASLMAAVVTRASAHSVQKKLGSLTQTGIQRANRVNSVRGKGGIYVGDSKLRGGRLRMTLVYLGVGWLLGLASGAATCAAWLKLE